MVGQALLTISKMPVVAEEPEELVVMLQQDQLAREMAVQDFKMHFVQDLMYTTLPEVEVAVATVEETVDIQEPAAKETVQVPEVPSMELQVTLPMRIPVEAVVELEVQ